MLGILSIKEDVVQIILEIYCNGLLLSSQVITTYIDRTEVSAYLIQLHAASKKKRASFFNIKITDSYVSRDWSETKGGPVYTAKFVAKDIIVKEPIPKEFLGVCKQPGV